MFPWTIMLRCLHAAFSFGTVIPAMTSADSHNSSPSCKMIEARGAVPDGDDGTEGGGESDTSSELDAGASLRRTWTAATAMATDWGQRSR